METRAIPNTSLEVSRACLGTMTFGGQACLDASRRMLHLALDRGICWIDTANAYNGGRTEAILGELLAGIRSSVVLASKVGIPVPDETPGLSRVAVLAAAEASLRRLRTDYLDIYYLHQPDYSTPFEETLAALDTLVREGKVRYVAVSNFASWQLCQLHWLARTNGWAGPRAAQPMYNLLARRVEDEFLPACAALDVFTVAYNPLAGGLLTGKHAPQQPLAGTRFDGNRSYQERYWNE